MGVEVAILIPTLILYAIMSWGLGPCVGGHCGPWFHTVVLSGPTTQCMNGEGKPVSCEVPPFDVPPVEKDYWKPPLPMKPDGTIVADGPPCSWDGDEKHEQMCLGGIVYKHYHKRTCVDKSRVLLMSQDSVWHCLALIPH